MQSAAVGYAADVPDAEMVNATNPGGAQAGCAALLAGVDEAGRGPLAGPVVAAAVILDPRRPVDGLADSKLLSARRRTRLARQLRAGAIDFAVALASPREIDQLNVLQASLLAMARALAALTVRPAHVQVDGQHVPGSGHGCDGVRLEAVVGGDRHVTAISAASILAKVYRDRLMLRWHLRHPQYGFDRNKGYPTSAHLEALRRHGPCPIHRLSFGPVAALLREVADDGTAGR